MAYNDQNEFPLEDDNNKSSKFLPRYFRTLPNKKFLSSTMDQIIQSGTAEKISAYYGNQVAKGFNTNDAYVIESNKNRNDYQFTPATVVQDTLGNVNFYKDYIDYINQINNLKGNTDNQSNMNEQEYYALNPHIDLDKFVNYREYYWLPYGPQTIDIAGQSKDVSSTYSVGSKDNDDNTSYVFTPDGITQNPDLTLVRGQTYTFVYEEGVEEFPFEFRTQRPGTVEFAYTDGVVVFDDRIEITVSKIAPDTLFYVNTTDINQSGILKILDPEQYTEIDVEKEVLGKRTYKSSNGIELSNGMKVQFVGEVYPEKYSKGQWYVEGVGDNIKLIEENDLYIPALYSQDLDIPFDTERFDRLPWDDASGYAGIKEYIVGNRSSLDKNYWSRSNRWFHKTVIEKSAEYNGIPAALNESLKAKKPIIEFNPNLKLSNFGTITKEDVDLVDTITTDAFSIIEGSSGYNIDGIDLVEGMRVLFLADTDVLVRNKIYEVKFIRFVNTTQITLIPTTDSDPEVNQSLLVKQGTANKGLIYHYNGDKWVQSQTKTKANQSPYFELYTQAGESLYSLDSVSQIGSKILSYKVNNSVTSDPELGFGLTYRNLENIGDIVFDFNLLSDIITYQQQNNTISVNSDQLLLRQYSDRDTFSYTNAWIKAPHLSRQLVIRQYFSKIDQDHFEIDMYDKSALLDDLWVRVYKDDILLIKDKDYTLENIDNTLNVVVKDYCEENTNVVIKTYSAAMKNENGYYDLPLNLQNNPDNDNITSFTFGEFTDHTQTIVEELEDINGIFPGQSDFRDKGPVAKHGKKFIQSSGTLNLANFHLNDENANIVKALDFNKIEYAKFKREFLEVAYTLGYDGPVKEHVDLVLEKITKDKNNFMPFYFSDMVAFGNTFKTEHKVFDTNNRFYPLRDMFDLNKLSINAVNVYHNDKQLAHIRDYTFTDEGFVKLDDDYVVEYNDIIDIYEYSNTDGSYIPPTPTKLGLYPSWVPEIYIDDTYQEPQKVIQGHDGSIRIAYNDYRDELLLELELRIFNNIKSKYEDTIFDIYDYLSGEFRKTKFNRQQIDNVYIDDFIEWLGSVGNIDYTDYKSFFSSANPFTFNYYASNGPTGKTLPGFWRGVYKQAYDTDRPHSHPWEILGFTIEPKWWKDQYGPRPYTTDNLPMWRDIEQGIVREPGKPIRFRKKFARPGLSNFPPCDSQGRLSSPLNSGYLTNYSNNRIEARFKFGDYGPTESAWRRSSEFPYSLIKSIVVNKPPYIFGTCFDKSRITRNFAGQIVYKESNKSISIKDLVFPNSLDNKDRIQTAGLVNFVANLIQNDISVTYSEYKDSIKNIDNKIGLRVGGFTNKDKFNLILDSRSPFNETNVFVPSENYKIFLNKSTATEVVTYSGVIIEKLTTGFSVRGYDKFNPVFKIYQPLKANNDIVIKEGGTSEEFVDWNEEKLYLKGNLVRFEGRFFRATEDHTSGQRFDAEKFVEISDVPTTGGVTATIARNFASNISYVDYGTTYNTIQEVIDFLAGYENYLQRTGFIFETFEPQNEVIQNWRMSMKDFLFWTTQSWQENSVITLSPGAETIKFYRDDYIVDNIFNNIYGAIPLNSSGKPINPANLSYSRVEKEFIIQPKNTVQGVYFVKLPLTQKEHIVLLDNETVFKDVIYNKAQGYRQQRVKVLGYRSSDWDGSINVPGFIIEDVKILDWQENTDYHIGDVVKYKTNFYVALNSVPGSTVLDLNVWQQLQNQPESGLYPNMEYKINQFADFYDLDTDNFDIEQQRLAQHLIGYQKRNYLQNILQDDVSQYKFYQGYIKEKGTKNSLTKLFDSLNYANKDSLEFYEEWAVRTGTYGASDGITELEFILDEDKYKLTPQPVETVNVDSNTALDLLYRQPISDVYLSDIDYDPKKVFPAKGQIKEFVNTAGYVNSEDVDYEIATYNDLLSLNASELLVNSYIWIGNSNNSWDVVKFENTNLVPKQIIDSGIETKIQFTATHNLSKGDIFCIATETSGEEILRLVKKVENEFVYVDKISTFTETTLPIRIFVSRRFSNLEEFSQSITEKTVGDRVWVDETGNNWGVYDRLSNNFTKTQTLNPDDRLDDWITDFSVDKRNTILVIGNTDQDTAEVYYRGSENLLYTYEGQINKTDNIADTHGFAKAVAISPDSEYIAIGAPDATNIKTKLQGNWDATLGYSVGDIVIHNDSYWIAQQPILPESGPLSYEPYLAYPIVKDDLQDSTEVDFLLAGNFPRANTTADHFLIRATTQQYQAVPIGSTLHLQWNKYSISNTNQTLLVDPFEGTVTGLSGDWLSGAHIIEARVDIILTVALSLITLEEGDVLHTSTGEGTVEYLYQFGNGYVIYLNETSGNFAASGDLFNVNDNNVGEYTYVQPDNTHANFGGYWKISTDSINSSGVQFRDVIVDNNPNLIIKDIKQSGDTSSVNNYYSVGNDIGQIGPIQNGNQKVSTIGLFESPDSAFPAPAGYTWQHKWFIRFGVSQVYTPGQILNIQENTFGQNINYQDFALVDNNNDPILNNSHTIIDTLDGYIKVQLQADAVGLHNFERGDILIDENTGARLDIWHASIEAGSQTQTLYVNWNNSSPVQQISNGSVYGDSTRITRRRTGEVDRDAGFILESSIYTPTGVISKLYVFDAREHSLPTFDFPPSNSFLLENYEYWIEPDREQQLGSNRPANEPIPTNNDWLFTNSIDIDSTGDTLFTNTGYISVYRRTEPGFYEKQKQFVLPFNTDQVGKNLEFRKINDVYVLYVQAENKIVFVKKGTENGITYNWEVSLDSRFRNSFNTLSNYYTNDIVLYPGTNGQLYQAQTDIIAGPFDADDWEQIDNDIDYTGSIPKSSNLIVNGDSYLIADFDNFYDFQVSSNGEVLAVYVTRDDSSTTVKENDKIAIYRYVNNSFRLHETIEIVDLSFNDAEYKHSYAINEAGDHIAIGHFRQDIDSTVYDSGVVDVYAYDGVNQTWSRVSQLKSPQQEDAENFGYSIAWIGNSLAISALATDRQTNFVLEDGTYFDNGFTTFSEKQYDVGQVYIFDKIGNSFVYSNKLDDVNNISRHLKSNGLHLYGLADYDLLVDYRFTGSNGWSKIREQLPIVEISKFKNPFIYDKSNNTLIDYLDIIDPIQGKIAGPAEQELSYKTHWDPAIFTNVTEGETVQVDKFKSWGKTQVGKLWWDLSTVRFKNPYQGSAIYQANTWNTLFAGSNIDIYEWVESNLTPEQWAEIADTEEGLSTGVSGQPKYGFETYSVKKKYDSITQSFYNKYYFWVKNSKILPNNDSRTTTAFDVSQYITNPRQFGYKFVELHTDNRYVVNNCDSSIKGRDTVLNFTWWNILNQELNIHNQYKIISDGLYTSKPTKQLEEKWIDSLIGFDKNLKEVPDPKLSPKLKYGTLTRPRQSWFINKQEALKEFIERTNLVLLNNLIVDNYDITGLDDVDPAPNEYSREFDYSVDSEIDLQFIGISKFKVARLEPEIVDGKIVSVRIIDGGRGYNDPSYVAGESTQRLGPEVRISGNGQDAVIVTKINSLGTVTSVEVKNSGSGYNNNTTLSVRPLSALVLSDNTINGKWSIAEYNTTIKLWQRVKTQNYDVSLYWDYEDWYATGFSQFTDIDHIIDYSYELESVNDTIGDIVKINTVGSGGWVLLQKEDDQESVDYSVNYKTIGKEKGTIQLSNGLFDYSQGISGFDGYSFDTTIYDGVPVVETRKIVDVVLNKIFTKNLAIEYNKIFIASLRYILSEGQKPDWLFKTSFVKAKHNFGQLSQKVHFQNDNLSSYEDYINEVKPFKTTIREYISSYNKLDQSSSQVTDFDLMPWYDEELGKISPRKTIVKDGVITVEGELTYPWKSWIDNATYYVEDVELSNPGTNYRFAPNIELVGGGGTGAKAVAYIARGKIVTIDILEKGSGYTSAPRVVISGSQEEGGIAASATAIIKNDSVRKFATTIKFDRTSGELVYLDLKKTETFTSTTNQQKFKLIWPLESAESKVTVFVDGEEALRSEYTYANDKVTTGDYTIYKGYIQFTDPLVIGKTVIVNYSVDPAFLSAADRVHNLYTPTSGMPGYDQTIADLSQVMDGIDYGGVEVTSFDFDTEAGWDADEWYSDPWDTFDGTFEDFVFRADGSTNKVDFETPLESGVNYNLYLNNVRIDDPNYNTPNQTNTNALARTVVGAGQSSLDVSEFDIQNNDIFVVRKETSEGTFTPDLNSFDTQLSGGSFAYGNARGLNAGEIIIDGDGFVTPTTSKSTEEHVPGQVLDTLDLKVYDRIGSGQGLIVTRTHRFGATNEYKVLEDKQAELSVLQADYTNADNDLQALNSQLSTLQSELQILQEDLQTAQDTAADNDLTQPEYTDLKSDESIKISEVNAAQANVNIKQSEIDVLNSQIGSANTDLTNINNQISSAQQSLTQLQQELQSLNSQLQSAQNDLNNYLPSDPEYSQIQNVIISLQQQISSKNSQISSTNSQISSLQSQLNSKQQQLATLQGQLQTAQSEITGLQSILQTKQGQLQTIQGQITAYEQTYQGYLDAVDTANTDVTNKQAEITIKTGQINNQNTLAQNIQNSVSNKQQEVDAAQAAVNQLLVPLDIGITPIKKENLIVRITNSTYDNKILELDQYTIDFLNKTVLLKTAPEAETTITTLVVGANGVNILDSGTFVGDGSTLEFLTKLNFADDLTSIITVDGEKLSLTSGEGEVPDVEIVESTEEYALSGVVLLRFGQPPKENSLINYTIYGSDTQTFSEIVINEFEADGSTMNFDLDQTPFNKLPLDTHVLVIANGEVQDTGYNTRFTATNTPYYAVSEQNIPYFSKQNNQIAVYLNGNLLEDTVDYRWYSETSTVELFAGVFEEGDLIELYTINEKYIVENGQLKFQYMPPAGKIFMYQFSNHDVLDIKRSTTSVLKRNTLVVGSEDWKAYSESALGIITLDSKVLNEGYVWLSLNGTLLSPTVDYGMLPDLSSVKIYRKISEGDEIDVIHYSGTVSSNRFGYKIFKDILNRTHYKRINRFSSTTLAKDLDIYDVRIEVEDGSMLDNPNKNRNLPGIVFINGERIEYFVKEQNTLRQIRRGTLGTGVSNSIPKGTLVSNQGSGETIPYKDQTLITEFTGDGSTNRFTLDFSAQYGVNQFEVFVEGKRLRKTSLEKFNPSINQTSPEADETLPAEFGIDGIDDNVLTLLNTPSNGAKIKVVRKIGTQWRQEGTALKESETKISAFLRKGTTGLPE